MRTTTRVARACGCKCRRRQEEVDLFGVVTDDDASATRVTSICSYVAKSCQPSAVVAHCRTRRARSTHRTHEGSDLSNICKCVLVIMSCNSHCLALFQYE